MGLFDNLFKAKPDAADEAVVEAARRIAEHEKARLIEAGKLPPATPTARTGTVPTPRPGSVPAPRAYSPRSLGQVVTPNRASGPSAKPGEATPTLRRIRLSGHEQTEAPNEIVLTLEDVLPRIPMDLISEQAHDLQRELRFKVEDLSADIARGRAAVSLSRIAEQMPELFREPILPDDQRQVRLPLQKLVEQIGFLPIKPTPTQEAAAPSPPALPGPGPALAVGRPVDSEPLTPVPSSVRISLNLAAVLRNCPRDLIVAELPPIPEHDRISFPWPPIEKQLSTGHVDVSSVRFIFALPAYLQGYFEAREGVRVPLPIEEIQSNIPAHPPEAEAAPSPEPAPPVVQNATGVPAHEIHEEAVAIPDIVFSRENVEALAPEPTPAPAETWVPDADHAPAVHDEPASAEALDSAEGEETAPPRLDLPPPLVAHAPPPLAIEPALADSALAPEPVEPVRVPAQEEAPTVLDVPSPATVPPPLHPTGDTAAPAPATPPLPPPNVWMQPPREIAARPAVPWPPDVLPPPSPLLPVRVVAPPVVRPIVAPPPLFSTSAGAEEIQQPGSAITPEQAPPPPPRPLDLHLARAALGIDGEATLSEIAAAVTRLPGITACLIFARHASAHAGAIPAYFDAEAARALAWHFANAPGRQGEPFGIGHIQHITIFADDSCASFFTRDEATVCAIHRARAFLPGVCEKLAAIATALAQA